MSYYGGTVTVKGRNLLASLMAGETIELTKIVVGSGAMPEGVEPIDMEDLVNPIALATSTVPTVEDGVLYLTVEYRNDMNGGLETGFWLREFGVYARTDIQTEEVLLYYATLGDSPQPVNAYKDNRIDIRRYPISIALALDAEVTVNYNPGSFITAADAEVRIRSLVETAIGEFSPVNLLNITIPTEGWKPWEDDEQSDQYPLYLDVECEEAKASMFPSVALDRASLQTAEEAGLCPTIQAIDGFLRFWAEEAPASDITGSLFLASHTGGGGGGSSYVLPVATRTVLGGVKIPAGSGLKIDAGGNLRVDDATEEEVREMYDDAASESGDAPGGEG